MIFNIIVLLIGAVILGAGVYYLVREKNDRESLKIYSVISCHRYSHDPKNYYGRMKNGHCFLLR